MPYILSLIIILISGGAFAAAESTPSPQNKTQDSKTSPDIEECNPDQETKVPIYN